MKNNSFSPLVSIIIPVYNGSNYVSEAIDSALAQTYKNIEIIVVNDGSTDNTEEVVKKYGKKVRYFKKENGGVSTALNLAIKKSKGEYISWLSHDDLYYPDKIERQIEELEKMSSLDRNNTIIFSHFDIKIEVENKILNVDSKVISYDLDNIRSYYFSLLDVFFSSKINGCTLLIPKNIFNKIGLFCDEHKTVQDYMLFLEFLKHGVKYYYLNAPLVVSRHHSNQDTHRLYDKHLIELNTLYKHAFDLFEDEFKNMPFWQFEHFLNIIKTRTLDKVYAHMLSGWASDKTVDRPVIWMYWENKLGSLTPDYIRLCWKSVVFRNKDKFNIKILTDDDIGSYLPDLNKKYLLLEKIAHKSDYIRFNLLNKYGGVWLDSDFVSFRDLTDVNIRLNDNSFICCAYKKHDGNFFPLIGFLAAKPKNDICTKMIKSMDSIINRCGNENIQPSWDEIGGLNLMKYINVDHSNNDFFIYDSSYFLPYPIHIDPDNNAFFLSSVDILSVLSKNNRFSFGQNIANSVLSDEVKNMSESVILNSNSFFGSLFRFSLSYVNSDYCTLPGEHVVEKEDTFKELLVKIIRKIFRKIFKKNK